MNEIIKEQNNKKEHIENLVKGLPDLPGVYIMKNVDGEVIYVGKAISLKNRVRQYFRSQRNHGSKVIAMVSHIATFDYIITDNEVEALILECNLIKKYSPRYNILLKDDKHFPYVRIDMSEDYPRVDVVRKQEDDKAIYLGPFIASSTLQEALEAIRANFPIRTCKKDISKAIEKHERPCLNFYTGHCVGPCTGNVPVSTYKEAINNVINFLQGKDTGIEKQLEDQMQLASDEMDFEKAAALRDRLFAIKRVIEKQKAISTSLEDKDIFALSQMGADTMIQGMFMRGGRIIGTEHYQMQADTQDNPAEILQSFLEQYYQDVPFIPAEIILQHEIENEEALSKWLSEKRNKKVHIITPQRGKNKDLIQMAEKNAEQTITKFTMKKRADWERHEGALLSLAKAIGLENPPRRIEAYDISNIQGTDSVASMVVLQDGRPMNKEYRRFKIKTVVGPNDFASMAEVTERRFKRFVENSSSFSNAPDLILIDGGKIQLAFAYEQMQSFGLNWPMLGLAKRLEEVYLPGKEDPIVLDKHDPALHVLQRIRDEAHRFAITYHRSLRKKRYLTSQLEEIKGIGKKRAQSLLKHFKSMDHIKKATIEELIDAEGMNKVSAELVYDYFHKQDPERANN